MIGKISQGFKKLLTYNYEGVFWSCYDKKYSQMEQLILPKEDG